MIIDITRINKSDVLKNSCIPDTLLCEGLQGELKAIVVAICGLPKFEQLINCEFDFSSATTQNALNQLIKEYFCELKINQDDLVNTITAEFDLCNGDNWDNNLNVCLEENPIGIKDTLQSAIKRIITLSVISVQLLNSINEINIKINNLETEITKIKNNCCNVTLVDRITNLEQRLLNANIP